MTYGPFAGIKIGHGFFYEGRHYVLLSISRMDGQYHVDLQPSGVPSNQRVTYLVPDREAKKCTS